MSFDKLVDETANQLRSFVRDQELSTWLTTDVSDTGLEIEVNNSKILSRGRVEVGNELIVLEDVDATRNVGVIPPYGRGTDGTEAVNHVRGEKVTIAPLFPRQSIADALNATIGAVSDRLWGVATLTFRASATRVSYELPEQTIRVLNVSIPVDPRVTKDRYYARDWDFDLNADYPTGKGLYLYDYAPVGRDFNVVIAYRPETLQFGDPWDSSGLPESARDVIMFGALARLLATSQTYALATRAVGSQTTLGVQEDPTVGQNLSKHFYNLHAARLEEEVNKLNNRYNSRVHYQSRGW